MELEVYKINGKKANRSVKLDDKVFAASVNDHAVYQAVQAQMTNSRQGNAATKTRSMVSGGGKKPWKQKGRGTARAGTSRSPIWRGGGIVHGPQPHEFRYNLPKKVKRLARISVLSSKVSDELFKVVEDFELEAAKTKNVATIVKNLGLDKSRTIFLVPEYNADLVLAARNLKAVSVQIATDASTYELLKHETVVVLESAVKKLEGALLS